MKNLVKTRLSAALKGKDAVLLSAVTAAYALLFIFSPEQFWGACYVFYAAAFLPALAVGAAIGLLYLIWKSIRRMGGVR